MAGEALDFIDLIWYTGWRYRLCFLFENALQLPSCVEFAFQCYEVDLI